MVITILLAFALRIHDLGKREFWLDEALSANISGLGWEGAVTHLRSEPFEHPPLYYLSLYPWQKLAGTSEFAFRFYSVFWGVLSVPLLYILVRRLTTPSYRRLSWLAALLATLSPFLVAYSQEARMYALLPCLALLTLLSFQNALQKEGQPGRWLVYVLLMTVGVATHYYFALIWVTCTVYLFLEFLYSRQVRRWGITVQALSLLTAMIWLIAAPGLRSSLARVWQGETAFGLAYKLDKVMPTLMLAEVTGGETPLVARVLAAGGWMLVLVGAWWSRRGQALTAQAWRLLMLFLAIPLIAALLIPYGVLGRHLGYTLAAILTFMALGLFALGRRGRLWLTTGILILLLMSTNGLVIHYAASHGNLGQAMAHINERGQPGDLLVLSQPAQQPLLTYYNDERWPVRYLPSSTAPLTPAEVDDALTQISQTRARLWLGPIGAWTADPQLLAEQWLSVNRFQAEKTWFPDSSSVTLYFTNAEGLTTVNIERLVWGGRIRLRSLEASSLQVAIGDALRLRFHWRAGIDLDERYVVRLSLADDKGLTWAERHSEPCGGWCPTDTWKAGILQRDLHALLIPPGTPPGTYQLQVAWLPFGGGAALQAEEDGQRVEQITVAQVTVLRPQGGAGEPWTLPNPLQAVFGGEVTLVGYQPARSEARPGEILHLETHWRATTAPSDDYTLAIELVDRRGQEVGVARSWIGLEPGVAASWQSAPSASFYPSSLWQPGEYLRGQHVLLLPSTLSPGRYRLRIVLVSPVGEPLALTGEMPRQALGGLVTWQDRLQGQDLSLASLRIIDRPRQFELPTATHTLRATVGRRAHLIGYDLDPSQAHPGGQLDLTLYWQADGPMARPFKVFTHLVDTQNRIRAQHDAPPGGGCCPTNTWAEGEAIVDEHSIPLGADLPLGAYWLVVGMYDEETSSRLPAYDAGGNQIPDDRIQIGAVTIEPAPATVQTEPKFDSDYVIYIPLLRKGKP